MNKNMDEQTKDKIIWSLYYRYMNQKIKEYCNTYHYFYFDIYDECCDEEGFLKKEYSDGNVHVRNTEHSSKVISDLHR